MRAFVTTREGGVSSGEHASMNLGLSSGDSPDNVARNRAIVRALLPSDPVWLAQVHGREVARLETVSPDGRPRADAAVTSTPGKVAVVLTADCMPVFFADRAGAHVGVAHAGWRGLAAGVLENTVRTLGVPADEVIAWMGPAIGPGAFEVGPEVREAFLKEEPAAERAFAQGKPGKYMADLYELARMRLARAGVTQVSGGGFCTREEPERFFSYRRAPRSGRMGAFIWISG
ncbi:MAG TPA: peptidoglycan editing factor PgeF [Usitatibacter sp.]|nr:peptidoglycan editing factor PgeF [Usitatibacter sp.]